MAGAQRSLVENLSDFGALLEEARQLPDLTPNEMSRSAASFVGTRYRILLAAASAGAQTRLMSESVTTHHTGTDARVSTAIAGA